MAACAITIAGTTGSVRINYLLTDAWNSLTAHIGDEIFISDAATSITYTTISGNATATSGCVTITELPSLCYLFSWETVGAANSSLAYFFDRLEFGSDSLVVDNTDFNITNWQTLASELSGLDERVTVKSGKSVNSTRNSINHYLVINILSVEIPRLRITNTTQGHKLYLIGEVSSCIPSGYTEFNQCLTT